MTTYIVKTILCSGILLIFYYLILEKEKMYQFNRIYLLFSIVFSFIIPLLTIKIKQAVVLVPATIYQPFTGIQNAVSQPDIASVVANNSHLNYLLMAYGAVSLILVSRFVINILNLTRKIRNNHSVAFHGVKLVLTHDNYVPHSFLNYVFINKDEFEKENIEKEILSHELAHIKQRHTIDILFIELITIFAWINPLLFIYRKAVQLNHEFLADEFVVKTIPDPHEYQLLLLDKAKQPSVLVLSSSFNYLQTKKRIIMMTKKTSLRTAILKQIALIPLILITGFLLSTRVIAQDSKHQDTSVSDQKQSPENDPSFNHENHSISIGFSSWVAKQIKYPDEALKNNAKGWVHVGYTVELDGSISNVIINAAPDPSLGEAVAKAVKSSPKWLPGKNTAGKSPFKSSLSIKFEIPAKVQSSDDIPVYAFGKTPVYEELVWGIDPGQIPQFPMAKASSEDANDEAIQNWVQQHMKYPGKALKAKIEGGVIVRFIVTKTGKLEDFLVTRSDNPELNNEALRVLSTMPDWKPATDKQGVAQNVYYHAEVNFKLPK
jgi:TonB family protein